MTGEHRTMAMVIALISVLLACTAAEKFEIKHQVTGAIETNCYLLYDVTSREAALIDIGGPVDSLTHFIDSANFSLKYILCTHGHPDHLLGIPIVNEVYPEVQLCLHELDFSVLAEGQSWFKSTFDSTELAAWYADPGLAALLDFDPASIGTPDVFLKDNQVLKLGNHEIRCLHSPGHSRGSICFYIGDVLFSGDVLFHRRVGRTDIFNATPEDLPDPCDGCTLNFLKAH